MALFTTGSSVGLRAMTNSAGVASSNVRLRATLRDNTWGGSDSMSWYRSKTFRRFSIANTWTFTTGRTPQAPPVALLTSPYGASTANFNGASISTSTISHNNYTITISWSVSYSLDYWVFQGWYLAPQGAAGFLSSSQTVTLTSGSSDGTWHAYAVGYYGGLCLVEGSLITMADGTTKPIEQLQPGDEIKTLEISGSPDGNSLNAVTELYDWNDTTVYSTDSTTTILDVEAIDAINIVNVNNGLIRCTHDHVYLVEKELIDGTRAWTYRGAFNLAPGDKLLGENGQDILVTSVTFEEETQNPPKAYSLTMLDNGTYIGNGIVSHNGYKRP